MSLMAHKERLITGGVLGLVLLGSLIAGGWALRVLVLFTSLLALYEFYALFWPGFSRLVHKGMGFVFGAACILLPEFSRVSPLLCLAILVLGTGLLFLCCFARGAGEVRFEETAIVPLGILYIPVLLQLTFSLSPVEQGLIMLAAIGTDVGGYYVGSRFGQHKMWPAASPKKSWEGSLGGLVLCVLLSMGMGIAGASKGLAPVLPLWAWASVGVLLNIAAQLGDFFESALKRSRGIKDSGALLPGHGGVLDRIDSLLFVLPVYALVKTLVA